MKYRFILFILLVLSVTSCRKSPVKTGHKSDNHYATGFSIEKGEDMTRLTVRNPWENATRVEITYFLLNHQAQIPDSIPEHQVLRGPVSRIICLSTSHLAFLDALGELDKVTGVSGSQYITHRYIKKRIAEGLVSDVGYGQNLDYEEIISQKPDLVMVYGVDSEIAGFLGKFRDLGIPAVIIGEYLEPTPLGKAEWLKFVALFLGKERLADSLFTSLESRYNLLKDKAAHTKSRPGVMVGLPYRDSWWIPGGNSYLARLIHDAGGNYAAKDNPSHESFVISMEDAVTLSSEAGFWIHTGMVTNREQIRTMDLRLGNFPLFHNGKIFNNNRRMTPAGGMDFWESGTVHPDLILQDLIRIFHPEISAVDSLTYYREIR